MTKEAIDLNGEKIQVSIETPVIRKNGQNYIHTPEQQVEYEARQAAFESTAAERVENAITLKRLNEYGNALQQIEYLVENGLDALIQRNIAIKNKHSKPNE